MENGSLDKRVFECDESNMLGYKDRVGVLKDVASGDMNGRLGDFGLARMHWHEQLASTSRVAGTVGYLAAHLEWLGRLGVGIDVLGSEDMDASLLKKINSKALWSLL
ncbi:hypothetical protein RJ641_036943 [Dillenia turbinata]|uniref:Uncharacterized protein n=1 Tax=Dillenia turbinata TaxID=194707 RepID=A0AAN8ZBE5_9MAGN